MLVRGITGGMTSGSVYLGMLAGSSGMAAWALAAASPNTSQMASAPKTTVIVLNPNLFLFIPIPPLLPHSGE
jgi:hypothetical protein